MASRHRLTAVLALLVAALQLASVGAVAGAAPGAEAAEYFCCCAGECHCTGDCCRHPPASAEPTERATLLLRAATPIMEAPSRCGLSVGTAGRSPESLKALRSCDRHRHPEPPAAAGRPLRGEAAIYSSSHAIDTAPPRAPPQRRTTT